MTLAYKLLGPPELHSPHPTSRPKLPKPTTKPPLNVSDNQSPLLLDIINPCLAFFFMAIKPKTLTDWQQAWNPDPKTIRESYYRVVPKTLTRRMEEAWNHDPETTLKLICYLRDFGGFSKKGFYECALWLQKNHPLTLACNVRVLGAFGCLKDLLEILYRVSKGQIKVKEEKRIERKIKEKKEREKAKDIAKAKRAMEGYQNDPDYRYLHNRISDLFAELLRSDIGFLNTSSFHEISMAAKWCPSIDSCYDKSTLLCESIAKKLFSREDNEEYKDLEEAHYAYRVRNRLQKKVLVPLRKALEGLAENYVPPERKQDTTMVAMKTYKKIYVDCEEESEFKLYVRIAGVFEKINIGDGLLLPHQVITSLSYSHDETQWQKLVEEFSKKGKLRNCVAVCDLCEGIRGTIKEEVCVAMGLLISELSNNPWKGKVFTFSEYPKLVKIKGDNLMSKSEFIREMDYGDKVNFQKIYDRTLQVSITENVGIDNMVKKIFVFTNKDLEESSKNNWVADYKEAWKSYRKRGFKTVPEIVFWNLTGGIAASPVVIDSPADNHHRGLLLISGFSRTLMTLLLKGDFDSSRSYSQVQGDHFNWMKCVPGPEDVMNSAITKDELKELAVID